MLECWLAFVSFDPVVKKYVPVPDGVIVEVVDRDPISKDDVLASGVIAGGRGRIFFRIEERNEERPDLYFRVLGLAEPEIWTSKNTWSNDHRPGYLKNFAGERIGTPEEPLTFRVTFDCFVQLVYWNEFRGEFCGIPRDVLIECVDANVFGDRVLGSGLTDHKGRVRLRLAHDHEKEPDLYFRYTLPEEVSGFVDPEKNIFAEAGIELPRKFSTKERFILGSLKKVGYLENFKSSRVGIWGSPYTFDVTAEKPRFIPKNRVRPLIDGVAIDDALIAAIERAEHHIHGEVMLYFNDGAGERVKDALLRAADRGVEVRLLFDANTTANSASLVTIKWIWATFFRELPGGAKEALLAALEEEERIEKIRGQTEKIRAELEKHPNIRFLDTSFAYVELELDPDHRGPEAYRRLQAARPFFSVARIDHRKMFVIDGKIVLLGGANVGREYLFQKPFDPTKPAEEEEWVKWHDCFVELEGPITADAQRLFRERWVEEGGDQFPLRGAYFPELEPVAGGADVCLLNTTPGARMQIHAQLLALLDGAKHEIWIENPYFSTSEVKERLIAAAKRGVRVVCIFPDAHNDSWDFLYAARLKYRDLIEGGVEVYEYQNHMTHAKVAIFDQVTVIGSANLNRASFFKHYEVQALIRDAAVTKSFRADMFEKDLRHSRKIELDHIDALLDLNALGEAWVRGIVDQLF